MNEQREGLGDFMARAAISEKGKERMPATQVIGILLKAVGEDDQDEREQGLFFLAQMAIDYKSYHNFTEAQESEILEALFTTATQHEDAQTRIFAVKQLGRIMKVAIYDPSRESFVKRLLEKHFEIFKVEHSELPEGSLGIKASIWDAPPEETALMVKAYTAANLLGFWSTLSEKQVPSDLKSVLEERLSKLMWEESKPFLEASGRTHSDRHLDALSALMKIPRKA